MLKNATVEGNPFSVKCNMSFYIFKYKCRGGATSSVSHQGFLRALHNSSSSHDWPLPRRLILHCNADVFSRSVGIYSLKNGILPPVINTYCTKNKR